MNICKCTDIPLLLLYKRNNFNFRIAFTVMDFPLELLDSSKLIGNVPGGFHYLSIPILSREFIPSLSWGGGCARGRERKKMYRKPLSY